MSSVATTCKRKDVDEDQGEAKQRLKKGKKDFLESKGDVLDPVMFGTSYYFSGYLRKVYPYSFEYKGFAKRRWLKRTITDVLSSEFRFTSTEKLEEKIKTGKIRVNEQTVGTDYVFRDGDLLMSMVHRHELAVLSTEIEVVHENENFLVINKPPSLPIHPCGRYRFNTTMAILRTEMGYKDLHICHRLDRLTSGLLMFAKNNTTAHKIHTEIEGRSVQKEYLCRVEGEFPDGEILVDQPLGPLCHKIGAQFVSPDGKESQTLFKKISFNGKSSLVHCFPKTGRTHQIRIHLQYLGHPIVNDPIYNSFAFGRKKGKSADYDGKSKEEMLEMIRKEHLVDDWLDGYDNNVGKAAGNEYGQQAIESYLGPEFKQREPGFDASRVIKDPACEECNSKYMEPTPKNLMLFLHALKYSGSDWSFETKRPFWAHESYDLM